MVEKLERVLDEVCLSKKIEKNERQVIEYNIYILSTNRNNN